MSVCLSVRLSVRPSVAKHRAQTAYWILIKFGVNMHKDMGMPPLLFIFSRSKVKVTGDDLLP